jgi:hypothetical protein
VSPHLRDARCRDLAISVPVSASESVRDTGSNDNPFRNSSRASCPASKALRREVKPHSRSLTRPWAAFFGVFPSTSPDHFLSGERLHRKICVAKEGA